MSGNASGAPVQFYVPPWNSKPRPANRFEAYADGNSVLIAVNPSMRSMPAASGAPPMLWQRGSAAQPRAHCR